MYYTIYPLKEYSSGGVPLVAQWKHLTSIQEDADLIPGLTQWVKDLWLWYRPVATALIQPLAWEPLYAMGVALKKKERKKERKKYVGKAKFQNPR